jgi:hypothetical protein
VGVSVGTGVGDSVGVGSGVGLSVGSGVGLSVGTKVGVFTTGGVGSGGEVSFIFQITTPRTPAITTALSIIMIFHFVFISISLLSTHH